MNSFRAVLASATLGTLLAIAAHWSGNHLTLPPSLPDPPVLTRATHYTADVSAPDFWSRVSVSRARVDFRRIREAGFNTVILIVSWTGFQPKMEAGSRSETHYKLLEELIATAGSEGLDVLLRVGYAHDISNTPDKLHHERAPDILRDPKVRAAWLAYLADVQEVAARHENFRYAFLTWEDFFFFDYTYADEAARMAGAERLGYGEFLQGLAEADYRAAYGQEARADRRHPIPVYNTLPIAAYSRFWDEWLLKLFRLSRQAMPGLNMEVRVDCDPVPTPERFICHERTFDLGGVENATTILYYTPAWGAENTGDLASAEDAMGRFRYMLQRVREHTDNPLFIDQFNFVDNTPGFERNTRVDPAQMDAFLNQAGEAIAGQTTGYALWTMWDVTANIAANGEFERGLDGWKTESAAVMSSVENGQYVRLEPGATMSYFVREGGRAGVPIRADQQFTLQFRTRDSAKAQFRVEVLDAAGKPVFARAGVTPDVASGLVRVEGLPYFGGRETLRIENQGEAVVVDGVLLFNGRQENGIFTAEGQPKEFADEIFSLNRRLASLSEPQPRYTAATAQSPFAKGVSADGWVGKDATFWLAESHWPLRLRAYVPETWKGYSSKVEIDVAGVGARAAAIQPGLNVVDLPAPGKFPALVRIRCSQTVKASRFDPANSDSRPLCFVLEELGPSKVR
jgi:hypothetical protein